MGEISGVPTTDIDNVDGFFTTQSGGASGTTTTTPTITVSGGTFGAVEVKVTNESTYTNPNYKCVVTAGATTTVADSAVDHSGLSTEKDHVSNTMNFIDSNTATGTRTVTVTAQEFGDLESAAATGTFDIAFVQNRYVRIRAVTSTGANTTARLAIDNIQFFTGAGGTGTEYPTTNLTSNTSETGIVVSQGHQYSGSYAAWKAVDSNTTNSMAWLLGTSAANNWWQIHWESGTYATIPTIKSMKVRFDNNMQTYYFKIQGSDTGDFTGEETDYGVLKLASKNTTLTFG